MKFRGISPVNLDAKGRMPLPVKYRDGLKKEFDGQLVATADLRDRCLLLYPEPTWDELEQKIQGLPNIDDATRRLQRMLIGHAEDVRLDGQGRILVPAALRTFARLEKTVVLVGQGHRFEIWGEEHWELRREQWLQQNSAEQMTEGAATNISL